MWRHRQGLSGIAVRNAILVFELGVVRVLAGLNERSELQFFLKWAPYTTADLTRK